MATLITRKTLLTILDLTLYTKITMTKDILSKIKFKQYKNEYLCIFLIIAIFHSYMRLNLIFFLSYFIHSGSDHSERM